MEKRGAPVQSAAGLHWKRDRAPPRPAGFGLAPAGGGWFSHAMIPRRFLALAVVLAGAALPAAEKPVFLYSRHFNATGETRYQPDGTYSDVLKRLAADFVVRVNGEPMSDAALAGVHVLLLSNPSDQAVGRNPPPNHVSDADIEVLVRFVERGGGLIVMGNQENHNLEIMRVNRLLGRFGLKFVNRYTDVKGFDVPENTPAIGGLRWGFYTGNLVELDPAHRARPQALVTNDARPPLKGTRNESGCLMAASQLGRGRVVAVADAGWIANSVFAGKGIGGVVVAGEQNWELFRRLSLWMAGR